MGSSLAAALRRRDLASRVVGYDLDPDTGARAMRLGLIDATAASAAQAVQDADLVVLAAPVGAMPQLLEHIAAGLGPSALVTDLGSTKADVMAAAREALGAAFARFVPAHPIAGGERTGPEGADPDLFEGCTVVITADRLQYTLTGVFIREIAQRPGRIEEVAIECELIKQQHLLGVPTRVLKPF